MITTSNCPPISLPSPSFRYAAHVATPQTGTFALGTISHASLEFDQRPGARDVMGAIDRFVDGFKENAAPFEWREQGVHRVRRSHHYADSRNQAT